MRVDEGHCSTPQARETARVVEDVHGEAVLYVIIPHESKHVVVDVAEVVHVGLDAPIEVEFKQARVAVEEPGVPAAHVAVGDHPAFSDADGAKVFEGVHEAAFVDPGREGPMLDWDDFVVAFCRGAVLGSLLCELVRLRTQISGLNVFYLEFLRKRLVVEKDPRILVFMIPMILQLCHTLHNAFQLLIPDQTNQRRFRFIRPCQHAPLLHRMYIPRVIL